MLRIPSKNARDQKALKKLESTYSFQVEIFKNMSQSEKDFIFLFVSPIALRKLLIQEVWIHTKEILRKTFQVQRVFPSLRMMSKFFASDFWDLCNCRQSL